jgi:transposase
MHRQFEERLVEPNSALGAAILYMQKRWPELTLFLRVADAPLDNNTAERALKKAILHRKNSLFYRTLAGAHVGDVFMSLIHSAELNKVSAYEYLVAVLRNGAASASNPQAWMPWNYARQRLEHAAGPDPPG